MESKVFELRRLEFEFGQYVTSAQVAGYLKMVFDLKQILLRVEIEINHVLLSFLVLSE